MKTVYEKRGWWKVSGESKKYKTKEEALAVATDHFEVVENNDWLDDFEEGLIAEEELITEEPADPLEALRQARIKRDGDIEEGSDYDPDHEEQELSEGSD